MKFLNDNYTLEIDDLGYKAQAVQIRNLLLNAETPFSMGISGRWGSGKTSLMRYLMASVGGQSAAYRIKYQKESFSERNYGNILGEYEKDFEHVHAIWFNPWEYEDHKEPLVGLLQEIHHHFSMISQGVNEVKKLSQVSVMAGLDLLGSLIQLGKGAGSKTQALGEKYEYDHFDYMDRGQRFKLFFRESIKKLLTTKVRKKERLEGKARIIIFIDDLDRCEEATTAKLLKEIKQYLSTEHCLFVFGMDRYHIEKSLACTSAKSTTEARSYLEKLFQSTFYLRAPREEKLQEFLTSLTSEYPFVLEEDKGELTQFIIKILDPIPRKLKGFINALYFHVMGSLLYQEGETIPLEDLKKLVLICYLKSFHEGVYGVLENSSDFLKSILGVFQQRDRFKCETHPDYFAYLELRSHIQSITPQSLVNDELKKEEFANDLAKEKKFLAEVYDLQAKHKTIENYMDEFVEAFSHSAFNQDDMKRYL